MPCTNSLFNGGFFTGDHLFQLEKWRPNVSKRDRYFSENIGTPELFFFEIFDLGGLFLGEPIVT